MTKLFDKMGMTPGRFRIEWISAAEGDKYAGTLNEMQALLDGIPREKLMAEINEQRPIMEQRSHRLREVPRVEEASKYSDLMIVSIEGLKEVAK